MTDDVSATAASDRQALLELLLAEEGLVQAGRAPIPRRAPDDASPPSLSFSQERMWFLDEFQDDTSSLTIRAAVRVRGALDVGTLRRCIETIVERHEALRTVVTSSGGLPRASVLEQFETPFDVVEVRDAPQLDDALAAEAARTFDLARDLPIAVRVLRLSADEHVLSVVMHHIASDAWSFQVFFAELFRLYAAYARGESSPLAPLDLQYQDYAAWQRAAMSGNQFDKQVEYWTKQLAGPLPQFELPPDHPRPAHHSFDGGQVQHSLAPALRDALREASSREGVTMFMTLLAAFELLLARRAGEEEVVIGTPVSGRVRPELEPLLGVFVNNLVLRTDLSGQPTFRELLRRVRDVTLGAFDNQDIPFEHLLGVLRPARDLSRTPLFQVFFNMTTFEADQLDAFTTLPGGLTVELLEQPALAAKFDLTLYVDDTRDATNLTLVYNRQLYDADTMRTLLDQYVCLLHQVAAKPDRRTSDYSLVTEDTVAVLPDPYQRLDATWHGSVPGSVLRVADRAPDRVAVTDGAHEWTYAVLGAHMTRLAGWLRVQGIGKGDVVAIYAHRSPSLVWAITSVLASGAAYLVLDPRYPSSRLTQYLRIARPQAWLSLAAAGEPSEDVRRTLDELEVHTRLELPALGDISTLDLGPPPGETSDHQLQLPEIGPDDLACITFTSGSTGVPKAVRGRHGSLTHFLPWMSERFGVTEDDRFSMLSGLAHDPLQRDIFWPLWLGATLVVPDPEWITSAGWLPDWMRDERISVAHLTPAMGQLVVQDIDRDPKRAGSLPHMRNGFFIGDVLTRRDVARFRHLAPASRVVNLYGTTETQRASAYYVVEPTSAGAAEITEQSGKEVLPLGKPMPGVQLLLMTPGGQPAGMGEIGEIWVRSPHLALGYLDDDALTSARFVRNRATSDPADRMYKTGDRGRYRNDGSIEFFGRTDQQVQLRGFRIELGEVQAALGRHPSVGDVVVQLHEDERTPARLVAYVVAATDPAPDPAELSRFLRTQLPAHMVPSDFVFIGRIPLTPNGKLDRQALPAPDREAGAARPSRAPRNPSEHMLVDIWQEVLGRDNIGIDDDFFELGGYSLLATRVFAMIEQRTGKRLPISVLFEAPTIAQLADAIRSDEWHLTWSSVVPIQPAGSKAPFFYVAPYTISVLQFAQLGEALGHDQPLYGLQPLGLDGRVPAHERVEDMAAHYIAELKVVQPEGPYLVGGHCSGAWVAFEMARQLEANGDDIHAVVLVDQGPPGADRPHIVVHRYLFNRFRFYLRDGRLRHSLAWQFRIMMARHLVRRVGPTTERFVERVRETHRRAFRLYKGGTIKHDVVLIRSAESLALEDKGWYRQWADRTEGTMTTIDVPGTHANLLVPPFVDSLAEAFTTVFDDAAATPR